jgi:hypothetical protein
VNNTPTSEAHKTSGACPSYGYKKKSSSLFDEPRVGATAASGKYFFL